MTTKCLLVDDEPIALRVLQAHLDQIQDVTVVAACTNALEAIEVLRRHRVDLVFLDIEMPQLTGLDFVRSLAQPPQFIVTTAHRDYALEGFELDAVDYLLKPVRLPRLLRALDKYRVRRGAPAPAGREAPPEEAPYLNLRAGRRTVKLAVRAITYVESLGDYVKIHTGEGRLVTKMRISTLEEKLKLYGFLRIHRSFLVQAACITAFTADAVDVAGRTLPISRTYRQAVLEKLREDDLP